MISVREISDTSNGNSSNGNSNSSIFLLTYLRFRIDSTKEKKERKQFFGMVRQSVTITRKILFYYSFVQSLKRTWQKVETISRRVPFDKTAVQYTQTQTQTHTHTKI